MLSNYFSSAKEKRHVFNATIVGLMLLNHDFKTQEMQFSKLIIWMINNTPASTSIKRNNTSADVKQQLKLLKFQIINLFNVIHRQKRC